MYACIMRSFFQFYQKALSRRPYLVQAIQTGALMGTGDFIAQTFVENRSPVQVDFIRTLKFSSIGLFVGGPALHLWYVLLSKYVGASGKTVALKKVFIDQIVCAPGLLFILLTTIGIMEGKNLDIIRKDMELNYIDVLKTYYYIWPWVQLINFYYVPLQYQVLLVQTVSLIWNTYLSWKTHQSYDINDNSSPSDRG